jgi:hypothetical protein
MAIKDIFASSPTPDKATEDFLKVVNQYSNNRDVLAALGSQDVLGKAKPGALTSILKNLGVPGRLIRGAIGESIGAPQLRGISGTEQIKALVRGDIDVGFGDFPGLKTKPFDSNANRAVKMAGAFLGDVVTDPISYIGAPGALSRKAAAGILVNTSKGILTKLPSSSTKRIDELVNSTPTKVFQKFQEETGVNLTEAEKIEFARTPINLFAKDPEAIKLLRAETVGNYLAEGLLVSRKELLNRLEDLTGSKTEALNLFKQLPEEVRGGIVLTGLTGKPLRTGSGKVVRLTPGTGESLGKFGTVANRARLAVATAANPVTKNVGRAGNIYADVKTKLFNQYVKGKGADELGETRFVDYVKGRELLGRKQKWRKELQGKALSFTNSVTSQIEAFKKTNNNDAYTSFISIFEDSFHNPTNIKKPLNDIEAAAQKAAKDLREGLNDFFRTAESYGLKVKELGIDSTYTPLVLKAKYVKRELAKEGKRTRKTQDFTTTKGRNAYAEYIEDPDIRRAAGFEDANNPGVVWLDPRRVNDLLKERAKKTGEEALEFETDPLLIFGKYANDLTNRIANKRFLDSAAGIGLVIQDVPVVTEQVEDYYRATFIAGLKGISPELRKQAEDSIRNIEQALKDSVEFKSLQEKQQAVRDLRVAYKQDYDNATTTYQIAKTDYEKAKQELSTVAPKEGSIKRQLQILRNKYIENAEDIKVYRNKIALGKYYLNQWKDNKSEWLAVLSRERANIKKRIKRAEARGDDAERLQVLEDLLQESLNTREEALDFVTNWAKEVDIAKADISAARELRDSLTQGQVNRQVQDTINLMDSYVAATDRVRITMQNLENSRNARGKALRNWRGAEQETDFENINNIDTLVSTYIVKRIEYLDAQKQLKFDKEKFRDDAIRALNRAASQEDIKAINAQVKVVFADSTAAVKRLADKAKASGTFIKRIINSNSKYTSVTKPYSDAIMKAADDLTAEQFGALLILKSDEKIIKYIDSIQGLGGDDAVVGQAMGDMFRTYKQIADIINPEILKKLQVKQSSMLGLDKKGKVSSKSVGLDYAKQQIFQERKGISQAAQKLLDEGGFSRLNVTSATENLFANSSVTEFMAKIYQAENKTDEFEKIISDYLDPITALWKTAVTVGRGPGYVATNIIGGMWMNYLGNVSIKNVKLAGEVLLKINNNLRKIEKENPLRPYDVNLKEAEKAVQAELGKIKIGDKTLFELIQEFYSMGGFYATETQFTLERVAQGGIEVPLQAYKRTGALQRSYSTEPQSKTEEKYREFINFLLTNRFQSSLNNMSQSSEIFLRLSAFLDGYEKYGDLYAAMANVNLLHFDYQDLSSAEEWVRRFVPFYTWSRNNVPAQIRALVMQPGKLQRAFYANEEFQNAYGVDDDYSWLNQVLPEYVEISDGFASRFEFGDNNIGFYLKLPYEDVNRMFQIKGGVPLPRGRELANMLGLFTTPIEIASGVDLSTGAPFSEYGAPVSPAYNLLKFLPGTDVYTDAQGQTRMNAGVAKALQDFIPQLSVAESVVSGATAIPQLAGVNVPEGLVGKSRQERALTDLLNVTGVAPIFGVSAVTLTPQTLSGAVRGRVERQRGGITKLASSGKYDTDFIRERLRAGMDPDDIALLLQAGYGTLKEGESTISEKTRRGYIESLSKL